MIIHRVLLKAVDEPLHALIEHSALHDLANSCVTQLRNINTWPLHFCFHSVILILTPLLYNSNRENHVQCSLMYDEAASANTAKPLAL